MDVLNNNLSLIASYKGDIKSAIEDKGVDMTSASLADYASKIGEIQTGGLTEVLSVSQNGTYYPGQGVDGFSQVVVDVPQSVTGYTEKDVTEKNYNIVNLNNSASYVASTAFSYDTALVTVSLPNCTVVRESAFGECTNLVSLNLPECTWMGRGAFHGCVNLVYVSLPNLISAGLYIFSNCSSLEHIDLPAMVSLNNTFCNCRSLKTVNLPVCNKIDGSTFINCTALVSVTLGYSSVCNLASNKAFNNTPIANGSGSIYVPSSLVESYKSATNWTSLSNYILSIPV